MVDGEQETKISVRTTSKVSQGFESNSYRAVHRSPFEWIRKDNPFIEVGRWNLVKQDANAQALPAFGDRLAGVDLSGNVGPPDLCHGDP